MKETLSHLLGQLFGWAFAAFFFIAILNSYDCHFLGHSRSSGEGIFTEGDYKVALTGDRQIMLDRGTGHTWRICDADGKAGWCRLKGGPPNQTFWLSFFHENPRDFDFVEAPGKTLMLLNKKSGFTWYLFGNEWTFLRMKPLDGSTPSTIDRGP